MLLTYTDFPGNPAIYPVYKTVVKGLLTASHANAKIKVFGSDKVRFSVFNDENGNYKLYLLNTAFNTLSTVSIKTKDKTTNITLEPCELKIIKI